MPKWITAGEETRSKVKEKMVQYRSTIEKIYQGRVLDQDVSQYEIELDLIEHQILTCIDELEKVTYIKRQ